MSAVDPRPVVLIDLSAIFRAAWHANADGALSVAFQATLDGVRRCANFVPGALVAICCDGRGNWRKEAYPEYKAQRETQPEAMYSELARAKDRLAADGYLLWTADGFEADDVIATAADAAKVANHERIIICSHDKDLLQCVEPGVTMLRTSTWIEVDEAAVEAKFGVPPHKLGAWLALVGDKSDNIPGAPGIGDVKATALVQRFGSIAGILQATGDELMATKVGAKTLGPAGAKAILDNADQIELALRLVTLRFDAPINFADIYAERTVKSLNKEPIGSMDNTNDIDEAPMISRGPGPAPQGSPVATAENQPTQPVATVEDRGNPVAVAAEGGQSTALVAVPIEYTRQLEPRSPDGAMKMAALLFDSRMYQRFGNAAAICATIIRGREMGLGALTSLDVFHIVEGKPCPFAYLIIARATDHHDCEYFQFIEATKDGATWETKHRKHPKPTRYTYTREMAIAAKLVGNPKTPNWDTRFEDMATKTAGAKLARVVYPSAALGLYAVEEMGAD